MKSSNYKNEVSYPSHLSSLNLSYLFHVDLISLTLCAPRTLLLFIAAINTNTTTIFTTTTEFLPERDEQLIRVQGAQISEMKHMIDRLREEAVTMRQMRDDAVHAMEQSEARREETSILLRTRVSTAEAERLALEHRVAASLADNDRREQVFVNRPLFVNNSLHYS